MGKQHKVIPIFVPHKGCPFDCIYCDQRRISGQAGEVTPQSVKETIERYLDTIAPDAQIEVAFYGGSFTGIPKEQQIPLLETAASFVRTGRVQALRLSTRPDYINEEILNYLEKYFVNTIELGVQSMDDEVLAKSGRGHCVSDVVSSSRLIRKKGIKLGIQTMIGLPGDSPVKALDTAMKVIKLDPQFVRIYPTLVIRGTMLERLYRQGEYRALGLTEAVEICAGLLKIYHNSGIQVIRIGLQPSENIAEGMDVVAGPFHPAFRQLVESRLSLHLIKEEIDKMEGITSDTLIIRADPSNLSNVIGQAKQNILHIKAAYGFKHIKVEPVPGLGERIHIVSPS